jgi:hypothetical protein
LAACDVIALRLTQGGAAFETARDSFWAAYYRVRLIGSEAAAHAAFELHLIVRDRKPGVQDRSFSGWREAKSKFIGHARTDLGTYDPAFHATRRLTKASLSSEKTSTTTASPESAEDSSGHG